MDQVLLQPFPSEAFFQQYEPHQTYEFPIAFRNNDKVIYLLTHSLIHSNSHVGKELVINSYFSFIFRWHDI